MIVLAVRGSQTTEPPSLEFVPNFPSRYDIDGPGEFFLKVLFQHLRINAVLHANFPSEPVSLLWLMLMQHQEFGTDSFPRLVSPIPHSRVTSLPGRFHGFPPCHCSRRQPCLLPYPCSPRMTFPRPSWVLFKDCHPCGKLNSC